MCIRDRDGAGDFDADETAAAAGVCQQVFLVAGCYKGCLLYTSVPIRDMRTIQCGPVGRLGEFMDILLSIVKQKKMCIRDRYMPAGKPDRRPEV